MTDPAAQRATANTDYVKLLAMQVQVLKLLQAEPPALVCMSREFRAALESLRLVERDG